ncbi:hypothetical protein BGZ79_010373 [Entomortierella chlamydospora]|nr:hypothetical protein BGZ79_010373 [Entomortierella chlamydospora]
MCSPDFVQGTCPMLESLDITASDITDKDLAQILGGIKTVKVLKAGLTGFGTMSFAALRPHFHELQNLSISTFKRGEPNPAAGAILREILVSCENLVKLDGPYVRAEDVMIGNTPWVATKLRYLSFVVKFPPDCDPSLHKAMFEQISRLTSLKVLSFRDYCEDHHSLDFRLSHGMGQLKRLSQLEDVYLEGTIQQMEEEDFLWLFENLDSFKQFYGKPCRDPSKLQKFKGLKKANGGRVKYSDYFA